MSQIHYIINLLKYSGLVTHLWVIDKGSLIYQPVSVGVGLKS